MGDQKEQKAVAEKIKSPGYAEAGKEAEVSALETRSSILQRPHEGVSYPVIVRGKDAIVATGANFFILAEKQNALNSKSPVFLTTDEIKLGGMAIKNGEKGVLVQSYGKMVEQRTYIDDKGVNHEKGAPILDEKGKQKVGNQYSYMFNGEQINTNIHVYNAETNKFDDTHQPSGLNIYPKQENNLKYPVERYEAKDKANGMEWSKQAKTDYVIAAHTGVKFWGYNFSESQIADIKQEYSQEKSKYFENNNSAYMMGSGKGGILHKAQNEKALRNEAEKANTEPAKTNAPSDDEKKPSKKAPKEKEQSR